MGMSFPLAFSVHKFISSVGADAGFAAIIGLAILVLLFFAQARETSSLRHHAEELIARISELEARLARLSQQHAQAAAAAAGAQVPEAPQVQQAGARAVAAGTGSASTRLAALEMAPFPPAFVGAPALTAATRLIPAGVAARAAAARVPVPVPVGAGGGAAPPEAPPEAGPMPVPVPSPTVAAPVAGPGPATAAGATNGASHTRVAPTPYRAGGGGASGQRGATMPPRGSTAAGGPRRPPARPGTTALPDHLAIRPERSRRGRIGLGLLVLAIAAGAVAVVLILTHHSSPSRSTARSSTTSGKTARTGRSTRTTAGAVLVNPATVTVSVLNGTSTPGLAARNLTRLKTDGFKPGIKATATDQTHQTTVVYYLPGHQSAATAVAEKLGLSARAVQAIDPATRNVAFYSSCAAPPCVADVVVLLGADLANR